MSKKERFPIPSKMKRIITNRWLSIGLCVLGACQSADKTPPASRTNEQILREVTQVHAVGKVIPASGWAIISSPVPARVLQLLIHEGDTVCIGQPLLELESGTIDLDIAEAGARLASLQAEYESASAELQQAKVYRTELNAIYETSRRLLARQAETAEKTASDSAAWQQQEALVRALEQKVQAHQASVNQQQLLLQKAEMRRHDFTITAPASGVVTELTAKIGQYINTTEALGRVADTDHPIVEAEVDELFATAIRIGQPVTLLDTGRPDTLASGRISFVSPTLSDKSILYETANESQDRRVRRIRISPDNTAPLTINAKVYCTINIR